MPYLPEDQIETAARNLRIKLGLDLHSNPDMMTVVVKLKHLGFIKNYRRVPRAEMPDDEAAFDPFERLLLIREDTFCAMNRDDPRARFTIAHEFGHMELGHKNTRHRNVSSRRIEKIAPTIKRDEAQANRFAGAFLAPPDSTSSPMDTPVEAIAKRFNLTSSAARVRKAELETIYRRELGIKRPLPQVVVDLLRDARDRGHSVTSLDDEPKPKK